MFAQNMGEVGILIPAVNTHKEPGMHVSTKCEQDLTPNCVCAAPSCSTEEKDFSNDTGRQIS